MAVVVVVVVEAEVAPDGIGKSRCFQDKQDNLARRSSLPAAPVIEAEAGVGEIAVVAAVAVERTLVVRNTAVEAEAEAAVSGSHTDVEQVATEDPVAFVVRTVAVAGVAAPEEEHRSCSR